MKTHLAPGVVWITGLSASGKSTAGEHLYGKLQNIGVANIELLDGEELRTRLDRKYGHSVEERMAIAENIVRIAADKIKSGTLLIVSTISHKLAMRKMVRDEVELFMEVYLKCPVEVCAARDCKGNYERAFAGKCGTFIGVNEPYELSVHPELVLDTSKLDIEECSEILFKKTIEMFQKAPLTIQCND